MRSTRVQVATYAILVLTVGAGTGCSVMEGAGRWTRESGESMEAYSKSNEGFLASVAGFGGRVNKAVGGKVESMASSEADQTTTDPTTASAAAQSTPALAPAPAPAPARVALNATATPAGSAQSPAASTAAGDAVTARAQVRLQELGYNVGKADGIVGAKTRAALQEYQRQKGLTVTGTLDRTTLIALGLASPTASRSGPGA